METAAFYLRTAVVGAAWLVVTTAFTLVAVLTWGSPSMASWYGRTISRVVMALAGVKVVVHHPERLRASQPCVYVLNHQSNLDYLFMGAVYPPRALIIGKREVAFFPIFGLLFAATRNILIDRRDRTRSIAGLDKAVAAMKVRGDSIWIFPEGTRNRTGEHLGPFKKGSFHMAIAAQRPLQPIVGTLITRHVDFKNKRMHGGTYHLDILEPIPTEGLTVADLEPLMQRTRDAMWRGIDAIDPLAEPQLRPVAAVSSPTRP